MASGRKVKVAASQFECCLGDEGNLVTAERLVRQSAEQGAQIILLQELFCNLYFCQEQDPKWFATAIPAPSSSSPSSPSLASRMIFVMRRSEATEMREEEDPLFGREEVVREEEEDGREREGPGEEREEEEEEEGES
mmetsp:Transcript_41299/g.57520  ORF Transcript_41299/g.57520 Transcript_41299/m.57520 type:complete len:137 (-) Transcript_41299:64-474(-)